jgi:predicted dinucleotide-binding enzyme
MKSSLYSQPHQGLAKRSNARTSCCSRQLGTNALLTSLRRSSRRYKERRLSTARIRLLAQLFPTTTIVKAGNTVSRETLRHVLAKGYPFIHGQPITVFYCGDDAPSKRLAAGLIGETSLEPVDVGPLEMARLLEPVGVFAQKLSDHGPLGHAIALNAVHELSDHSPIDGIM